MQYNDSEIAVAQHKTLPTDAPLISWTRALDVKLENGTSFQYDAFNPVPDWVMQDQRHACECACHPHPGLRLPLTHPRIEEFLSILTPFFLQFYRGPSREILMLMRGWVAGRWVV